MDEEGLEDRVERLEAQHLELLRMLSSQALHISAQRAVIAHLAEGADPHDVFAFLDLVGASPGLPEDARAAALTAIRQEVRRIVRHRLE